MSKIVAHAGSEALVAGMAWQVLVATSQVRKAQAAIRESASSAGASKVCVLKQQDGGSSVVGLYKEDDDIPPGVRRLHSLAAIVTRQSGGQNLIVTWVLNASRVAVIVVEAGLPILDTVQILEDARATVQSYRSGKTGINDHQLFTNDTNSFPDMGDLDVESTFKAADSSTRLISPPVNVTGAIAAVMCTVLVGVGIYAYHDYSVEAAKKEAARKAAAANPLPKYKAAVASNANRMGISPRALRAAWEAIASMPVWVDGWVLRKVVCDIDGACVQSWSRQGGSTGGLMSHFKGATLLRDSGLDEVQIRVPQNMDMVGDLARIPEVGPSMQATATLQTWIDAGVSVAVAANQVVWPKVPGLQTNSIPAAELIRTRKIKVTGPVALLNDLFSTIPEEIGFEKLSVNLQSGDVKGLVFELEGNSYGR